MSRRLADMSSSVGSLSLKVDTLEAQYRQLGSSIVFILFTCRRLMFVLFLNSDAKSQLADIEFEKQSKIFSGFDLSGFPSVYLLACINFHFLLYASKGLNSSH